MTTPHNPLCPTHHGGRCPAPAPATLLFLHGMGATARSWDPVVRRLPATAHTLAYDQRGHGHSAFGRRPPTGLAQLGDDLARVLTHPSDCFPGPMVLVGHSAGGIAIMHCAATHPHLFGTRVTGAALISTTAGRLDPTCGLRAPAGPALARLFLHLTRSRTPVSSLLLHLMTTTRWPLYGRTAPRPTRRACSAMIRSTPPATLDALLRRLSTHDGPALTALTRVPVLIAVGADDRLTPRPHSRALAQLLPHAHLVEVAGAGHVLPLEAPDLLAHHLRRLLPPE
ncbi:alpha/beta hydrolase [Streptomyces spiroverticillatus]|uniref:Alpha/beta hydrolase n=1 Tax=Streptomyces finlayi TaxID=67296 RepID=A0A919CGH6_9ACTN|nr:alpha/beta hydrolase [Streptomyces finlayi]GHA47303.1 alpha/beta hydrolase [Streptomyces spiroverticillatus]GHD18580.1 alpha/beta hydrolase [Streptomyces finlayi]